MYIYIYIYIYIHPYILCKRITIVTTDSEKTYIFAWPCPCINDAFLTGHDNRIFPKYNSSQAFVRDLLADERLQQRRIAQSRTGGSAKQMHRLISRRLFD